MSKFVKFILFNTFAYVIYLIIDKFFTLLHLYSNPQLGVDITVMPTSGDIFIIVLNTLISSIGAVYILKKMDE